MFHDKSWICNKKKKTFDWVQPETEAVIVCAWFLCPLSTSDPLLITSSNFDRLRHVRSIDDTGHQSLWRHFKSRRAHNVSSNCHFASDSLTSTQENTVSVLVKSPQTSNIRAWFIAQTNRKHAKFYVVWDFLAKKIHLVSPCFLKYM